MAVCHAVEPEARGQRDASSMESPVGAHTRKIPYESYFLRNAIITFSTYTTWQADPRLLEACGCLCDCVNLDTSSENGVAYSSPVLIQTTSDATTLAVSPRGHDSIATSLSIKARIVLL